MDLTDIPEDASVDGESPPELTAFESPESLLKEGPTRERVLDVVLTLRTPTKVSEVAAQADCDTETARDYLEWFDEMGMVLRHDGRPVQYERNDSYFEWRRIDQIREQYSEQEIVAALAETIEQIKAYRAQFDVDEPAEVSLLDVTDELSTEDTWEALSAWETLERRAALLDAARRDRSPTTGRTDRVDA